MNSIGVARRAAGITQARLAELSGVQLGTLQKLESGENDPHGARAETILKIARALGITVEALMDEEHNR